MRLKLVSQFALIEEVYIFQVWPGNILQVCPSQAQLGTAGIAKEQRARPRSRLRHSLSLALVIIIIIIIIKIIIINIIVVIIILIIIIPLDPP